METRLLSLPCAGVLASTLPVVNDQRCWNSSCTLLRPSSSTSSSSSALVSHSFSDWICVTRSKRSPPSVTNARCVAQVDMATVFGSDLQREARQKKRRNVQVHADKSGSSASPGDSSVPATLEQSRRLLAKQKELLQQIEEQKKLYAAITRNTTANESDQDNSTDESTLFTERQTERSRTSPIEGFTSENTEFEDDSGHNLTKSLGRGALAASWPSPILPRISSPKDPGKTQVKTSFGPPVEPFSKSVVPSLNSSVTADPTLWEETDLIIPPSSSRPTRDLEEAAEEEEAAEDDETEDIDEGPPLAGSNVMNVVLVAAECAPWSKTGGLGDVVGALPKALARRGHRVMVVAPRYSNYMELWDTSIRKIFNVDGQDTEVGYFHGYRDEVDFVFVDSPVFHNYANNIYGGSRQEVLLRMILLCKAAVEAPWHVPCGGITYGDGNLVFIANDWHTALLPVYLRAYYQDIGLMPYARCVLVIHNMAHQGRGPSSDFDKLGLPPHYADKFILDDPIGGVHCNIFKAGFLSCHRIVTVSRGYAQEVQTNEGGWGLAGIIKENSWKLRGVVNGIDEKEWNPEIDPFLEEDGYSNYSLKDMSGKALCKAALQKELGLPVRSDVPLIGFIGRLDFQKGVDIIADAMPWMMSQELQLVMLGSGRRDLEDMLRSLEGQHKDKVRGWVGFSVKMAHRITAGADILLMPSRFEPCGLNQLYAMKYGTIPVVHSVGGLKDTVQPFNPYGETGTGWTFNRAEASGLIHALGNAMWTYLDFKESWKALQERGMSQDLSWDNAAQLYEEILVAAKYQW